MATDKQKILAYVPEATYKEAKALANVRDWSVSTLVKVAIRKEIDEAKESGELPQG
jgi:hypothetical protein